MNKRLSRAMKPGVLLGALAMLLGCGCTQPGSRRAPLTASASYPLPIIPAAADYQPVSFETLAAFPLKVDWLINPTNSSFDTLRRRGEIPAAIQALKGPKR